MLLLSIKTLLFLNKSRPSLQMKYFNLHYGYIILFFFINSVIYSQTDIIDVTTTGVGISKDEATKNALRNALESSFGAFISSKTEIVNDEIVNDEITSISTGNIVSYEIVSSLVEENNHFVTVNSQVSLVRFSNYIQSKGHNVTFNGNSFVMNEKVQEFNRVSEEKTIKNILSVFEDKLKKSIEFKINVIGNPILSENKEYRTKLKFHENVDLYELKMSINWGVNDNFTEAYKFLLESLKSLSMKKSELEYYYRISRDVFPIYLTDQVLESIYNYKLREFKLNEVKSLDEIRRELDFYGKTSENRSSNYGLLQFSGLNIFLRSKKSIDFLLNSFAKTQSFIYNFKIEFGIGQFYPSKYIETPKYKDFKIDQHNKSTYLIQYITPRELINLYDNDFLSSFKISEYLLPGIVTSENLTDKFSWNINRISDNLLIKQEIQNLNKKESEIVQSSIPEDDVSVLDLTFEQYLEQKTIKDDFPLKNKNDDSELKQKKIYPKLILIPFKNYKKNILLKGGFLHEFNLFLTLDDLDKIKDVNIINLN